MFGNGMLDLGAPLFWMCLCTATFALSVLTWQRDRNWAFGCVNLICLGLLAGMIGPAIAVVISVLFATTTGFDRSLRGVARWAVPGFGVVLLVLFFLHKRPDLVLLPRGLRAFMLACGFSYVALRATEFLVASWEGRAKQASWVSILNYLFPFHMLAAGPIQGWDDYLAGQRIRPASPKASRVLEACERIASGLFKRFVVAQLIQILWLTDFRTTGFRLFVEIQANYIWVYLDFSAYSDIAVGAGQLMGIATPENFNAPLGARNIIVFWERWHISLSTFIRRNIFTPTLLNLLRQFPNLPRLLASAVAFLLAFVLCGLWHGINLRFLLWGLFHGAALILCNTYGHVLERLLGREAMNAFRLSPTVTVMSTLLTFEFVALSLAFIQHPALAFLD